MPDVTLAVVLHIRKSGGIMAKKRARKTTAKGLTSQPLTPSFDEMFPTIARWISQEEGWVELGADHYSRSLARALYGGGMVWEGTNDHGSIDEALRAMEGGIAEWLEVNRPDRGRGESAKEKPLAVSPERPKPRKKTQSKAPALPERDDRVKPAPAPPVPRAVVEKVRKFAEIAEALRRGQHFEITRLTSLKGLCKEPRTARSFAMFLVVHARKKAEEKKAPERVKGLMDRAITEMESYLDNRTQEQKERLYPLLREMEQEQSEHRRISWGQVRVVHSMELVVAEDALKSILREHEAPFWLYQAARDYAERYDSRYGTGLIPSSAPMMEEIAEFWRGFFGLGR
jgi:hypothetical protein